MPMKLRDDVVLEEVDGEYVLVALRSAWNEVAFVRSVPKRHVKMFHCLEMGVPEEEMISLVDPERKLSDSQLRKTYEAIRDGRLYHGYLVEKTE